MHIKRQLSLSKYFLPVLCWDGVRRLESLKIGSLDSLNMAKVDPR